MLVSATEMLKKAVEGKYAVGQFNINNLEWTKSILQTAQENNSPVILGVSEGAGKYINHWRRRWSDICIFGWQVRLELDKCIWINYYDTDTYSEYYLCNQRKKS